MLFRSATLCGGGAGALAFRVVYGWPVVSKVHKIEAFVLFDPIFTVSAAGAVIFGGVAAGFACNLDGRRAKGLAMGAAALAAAGGYAYRAQQAEPLVPVAQTASVAPSYDAN